MVTGGFDDFFLAVAGAAAALIGLLFVAVSVAPERVAGAKASTPQQIRATTALDALVTPLVLALVALLPGDGTGTGVATTCLGAGSLLYVVGSVVRLLRVRRREHLSIRALTVVVGLMVVAAFEIEMGVRLIVRSADSGAVQGLGALCIISIGIGIDRAWELVGAGSTGMLASITNIVRPRSAAESGAEAEPARLTD